MTAQKGRDLLLKIYDSDTAAYVTVAGMRSRKLAFNATQVDVTDAESTGRWRELLEGAGVQRASLSGAGLFKDQSSDELVRVAFFDGTILDWQVIVPDFGTVSGLFQITALEYSGKYDGEVLFDLALESAGELTFEAA